MPKNPNGRSLRNEDVGRAYMLMLDIYDECRHQELSEAQISQRIHEANPWNSSQAWLCRAWSIAEKEFCKDYALPRHRAISSMAPRDR